MLQFIDPLEGKTTRRKLNVRDPPIRSGVDQILGVRHTLLSKKILSSLSIFPKMDRRTDGGEKLKAPGRRRPSHLPAAHESGAIIIHKEEERCNTYC